MMQYYLIAIHKRSQDKYYYNINSDLFYDDRDLDMATTFTTINKGVFNLNKLVRDWFTASDRAPIHYYEVVLGYRDGESVVKICEAEGKLCTTIS